MTVLPYGPHQYKVVSEGNVYWVNLLASEVEGRCDCSGYLWRGGVCKHQKAVIDYEDSTKVGKNE